MRTRSNYVGGLSFLKMFDISLLNIKDLTGLHISSTLHFVRTQTLEDETLKM